LFTLFGPLCAHLRTDAEFRRRRKSLAPPPAEFWSARRPLLVRASRKMDGGAAEGSSITLMATWLYETAKFTSWHCWV